jgi:hypothetical protein
LCVGNRKDEGVSLAFSKSSVGIGAPLGPGDNRDDIWENPGAEKSVSKVEVGMVEVGISDELVAMK